jgi:copper chaperone
MNQVFTVKGMTCVHCEKTVLKALLALDAQAKVLINRLENSVQVDTNKDRQVLIQSMVAEGYQVSD